MKQFQQKQIMIKEASSKRQRPQCKQKIDKNLNLLAQQLSSKIMNIMDDSQKELNKIFEDLDNFMLQDKKTEESQINHFLNSDKTQQQKDETQQQKDQTQQQKDETQQQKDETQQQKDETQQQKDENKDLKTYHQNSQITESEKVKGLKLGQLNKMKNNLMQLLRSVDRQLIQSKFNVKPHKMHTFIDRDKQTQKFIKQKQQKFVLKPLRQQQKVINENRTLCIMEELNNQKIKRHEQMINRMKKRQEQEIKKIQELEQKSIKIDLKRNRVNLQMKKQSKSFIHEKPALKMKTLVQVSQINSIISNKTQANEYSKIK